MLTIENLRQKNFTPNELIRSNTAAATLTDDDPLNDIVNIPNQKQLANGVKLSFKMQELRDKIKKSITPTSGVRCPELNKAVGGAPGSWHQEFLALDFNIKGMKPHEGVLAIRESGVSFDKVLVERGCIHAQTCFSDDDNRNLFGTAVRVDGEWKVEWKVREV